MKKDSPFKKARLKFVAEVEMGQSIPSDEYTENTDEALPFLQGSAEFTDTHPKPKVYSSSPAKVAQAGDILFSMRAPVGDLNIADRKCGIGRGLCAIRPKEEHLNRRYAWWVLHVVRRNLRSISHGSTYDAVSLSDVENTYVPVPPIEIQDEITRYVDNKVESIDNLITTKRNLTQGIREKCQSIISHAVTRSLDEVPMQDSGYPWLGEIPEHWEPMYLKRALDQTDYGTSESTNSEGDIAVLGMGDIGEGDIFFDDLSYLDEDEVEDELLLQPGDLLFNRTNSLERIAKVALFRGHDDCPISFASYLVRLRCKEWMDPEYLNYLLNSPEVLAWARGNAIPAIGQANLSPRRYGYLPIAVPPLDEQKEIVDFIDEETRELERVSKGTEQTIDLLEERRRSLITAAVTGQLDVGVPA